MLAHTGSVIAGAGVGIGLRLVGVLCAKVTR